MDIPNEKSVDVIRDGIDNVEVHLFWGSQIRLAWQPLGTAVLFVPFVIPFAAMT
jgi:hypothetical protein